MNLTEQPHIREFVGSAIGQEYIIPQMTGAVIDLRAIGYRSHVIGGRSGTNEAIAEQIVVNELENQLADLLLSGDFIADLARKLLPRFESTRFEKDKVQFTLPMINKLVRNVLSKKDFARAELVILANVFSEIFATAISPLGVVLPFKGVLALTKHDRIIPRYADFELALKVKDLTEAIDFIKLDPGLSRIRTISAAALIHALIPIFGEAGRLIKERISYQPAFPDTMSLLADYVTQSEDLPMHFRNNADLKALASNMTLVSAALEVAGTMRVETEIGEMRSNIAKISIKLREIARFKIISLSELQQHYSHSVLMDTTGQKVEGLVFSRNMAADPKVQITEFVPVGDSSFQMWEQVAHRPAEMQLEALTSALVPAKLTSSDVLSRYTMVASYVTDIEPLVHFINGATEFELIHYAAAFAKTITLINDQPDMDLDDDAGPMAPVAYTYMYLLETTEVCFDSQALIIGNSVSTADPAECIIHSGIRHFDGTAMYSARTQGILETDRDKLMFTHYDEITIPLDRMAALTLNVNGVQLRAEISVQKALGLNPMLKLQVTKPLSVSILMKSAIEDLLTLADARKMDYHGAEMAGLKAAMAINEVLRPIYESRAAKQLAFAIGRSFLLSVPKDEPELRARLKGHLNHAEINHMLLIWASMLTLIRAGYIEYDLIERVITLFEDTKLSTFMVGSAGLHAFDNLVGEMN